MLRPRSGRRGLLDRLLGRHWLRSWVLGWCCKACVHMLLRRRGTLLCHGLDALVGAAPPLPTVRSRWTHSPLLYAGALLAPSTPGVLWSRSFAVRFSIRLLRPCTLYGSPRPTLCFADRLPLFATLDLVLSMPPRYCDIKMEYAIARKVPEPA